MLRLGTVKRKICRSPMTRVELCCGVRGVDGVSPDACRLVRELSTGVGGAVDNLAFVVGVLLSRRTDS